MKYQRRALYTLLGILLVSASGFSQAPTAPPQLTQERIEELVRAFQAQAPGQRSGGGQTILTPFGATVIAPRPSATGAWWTNSVTAESLGLTADQKTKLERTYENHKQKIVSSTETLEKEEAQLARLLAAESLDRNAVFTQIDRVVQARGEVERANSAMTMEMRETLTRAQWLQLHPERTRVGAAILSSNIGYLVEPVYPEAAKQAGIQGVVSLELDISKDGNVEAVRVISGPSQLTQSAVDAVKQWRFRPTLLNGEPLPVVGIVNVSFPFAYPGGRGGGGRGGRGGGPTPVPGPDGAGQRRGGRGPAPQ